MGSTSHVGLLALFAFYVAVVFAVIAYDEPRQQVAFGARVFGGFVAAGLVLGWLMYPLPL
jgi:hypothetical protein